MGSLDRGTLPNIETAYVRARLAEFQRRSARDIDWQKRRRSPAPSSRQRTAAGGRGMPVTKTKDALYTDIMLTLGPEPTRPYRQSDR